MAYTLTDTKKAKQGDKMSTLQMPTLKDLAAILDKDPKHRKEYRIQKPLHDVANGIVARRRELNMTQNDLAQKLGKKQSAISRIESVENNIRINTLAEIAEALDATLEIKIMPRFRDEDYQKLMDVTGSSNLSQESFSKVKFRDAVQPSG